MKISTFPMKYFVTRAHIVFGCAKSVWHHFSNFRLSETHWSRNQSIISPFFFPFQHELTFVARASLRFSIPITLIPNFLIEWFLLLSLPASALNCDFLTFNWMLLVRDSYRWGLDLFLLSSISFFFFLA